jgi:hypothetical protein
MSVEEIGAVCFGFVIGWIVYRTLRRSGEKSKVSDLATVIGAVGGGAVTALFDTPELFGWYSIGLAVGFFLYMILGHTLFKNSIWMKGD